MNLSNTPITTVLAASPTTSNLEQVAEIIPRTKLGRAVVGKMINCRFCKGQARIYLEARQYRVNCATCGDDTYLKNYNHPSL